MATTLTAATGASTAGASAAAASAKTGNRATLGSDFGTFLTLLTTQLKNQDPTKAMDTTQMTQQLVQFAEVEQQIGMNQNLQKLIGLQQAAQLTAAAPLVGRTVEVESDQLPLVGGRATLRLPAAGTATRAAVVVQDGAGRVVRAEDVPLRAGAASDWVWDGRDALGARQKDGAYRVTVGGRDAGGGAQPITAAVRAQVTGAEQRGGALQLMLGPVGVGFDKLRSLAN